MVREPLRKAARARRPWLIRRGRMVGAALLWLAAGVGARLLGAGAPDAVLIGWNLGALAYVAGSWRLFLSATEADVRRRAAEEDESRTAILVLVVTAILASLAAIVWLLMESHAQSGLPKAVPPAMAVATLISSWLAMQTIFVLHYAHRHFAGPATNGSVAGGFEFAGEPARTYQDFVYLSFGIGAAFQVSDVGVRRTELRNLVAAHSAIAYFYNTAILALGINIVAGLIGR